MIGTRVIVVGAVKFGDKILLIKRRDDKEFSPGKWELVSGFLKEYETSEEAVVREVKEETDLDCSIVKYGKLVDVEDKYGRWVIIPYLCEVKGDKVILDPKEHEDFVWIYPKNAKNFNCVADIQKDLEAVGLL